MPLKVVKEPLRLCTKHQLLGCSDTMAQTFRQSQVEGKRVAIAYVHNFKERAELAYVRKVVNAAETAN